MINNHDDNCALINRGSYVNIVCQNRLYTSSYLGIINRINLLKKYDSAINRNENDSYLYLVFIRLSFNKINLTVIITCISVFARPIN